MDGYTRSLRERKAAAWESYQSLVQRAADEKRDLTPEEVEQRERIDADLDALNAEEMRHRERVASMDLGDTIRAHVAPVVEKAVKRDENPFDAFRSALQRGLTIDLETRALGNTPDGGTALTSVFSGLFVDYERTINPTVAFARVLNTPDNTPIEIFTKSADQAYGGTVTAEGGGIVAADPTLGSVTLYTYKYPSITFVSNELWRSNVIDLVDVIADGAAREIGIDFGTHLTTGTGSDQPNGFITAGGNGGTASGTASGLAPATFYGGGDVISLYMAVAAPYRSRGTWMASTGMVTKVRSFVDSNGHPIYNPLGEGISGSPFGSLLGRPLAENPAMADPASATKSIAFGDFSRYVVRRLPLRVDIDPSFKFQNDQMSIRTILEGDGDLTDSAAVKYLVAANT